jgi:hypothetical protein
MNDEQRKTKKPGYMKWYPERWLGGSNRDEFTAAQSGIWVDMLCLGYMNDPPGQIDVTSLHRLANKIQRPKKMVLGTIRRAVLNNKIRIIKVWVDPQNGKKLEDFELNLSDLDTFAQPFDTKKSKVGVPLYAIIFLRWDEFQPAWLRQRPYKKKDTQTTENDAEMGPDIETHNPIKGEERINKDVNKDKFENPPPLTSPFFPLLSPPSSNPPNSPLKGKTVKDDFLAILKACPGYPFDEGADSLIFDITVQECTGINILEQTTKKIAWWKNYPDALKANPRAQLQDWFQKEKKFKQQGGPQPIGEILEGVTDPDYRNFLKELTREPKHKRSEEEN